MDADINVNRSPSTPQNIAVIGASGSIGSSALDVIASSNGRLRASILAVHRSTRQLIQLAQRFQPDAVVVSDPTADMSPLEELPKGIEILVGEEALNEAVRRPEIDVVLLAIVGVAGLRSTWSALDAGKTVALANKEALVAGGALITDLLNTKGGKLYPVDSEHSAIFQCLLSRRVDARTPRVCGDDLKRIILTASGGPFRTWSLDQLKRATVQDALKHPTWKMGAKITVDSATTMNKALEIIEARWLFDVDSDKISVVVHPQSIVHSMVEFIDGAVLAQLSPPDMRLPIQFALEETTRTACPTRQFDWTRAMQLEFLPPDFERFPAMKLGFEVAKVGGSAGVVLNAANEIAVDAFMNRRISFDSITKLCRRALDCHNYDPSPTLTDIFKLDAWTRKETEKWISQ